MVALADRYIFSLIARAMVRGVSAGWMENLYGFALVPDLVVYLDIDVSSSCRGCCARPGSTTGSRDRTTCAGRNEHHNFVEYQTRLLSEFRRLADPYGFDRRRPRLDRRDVPFDPQHHSRARGGHDGCRRGGGPHLGSASAPQGSEGSGRQEPAQ